ncbi:MAG: hypothetical protein NTY09_07975 [bacterium]|nr:hypothetical protein [bacterium]
MSYPIYFVIFKSALWLAGLFFIGYMMNQKLKRFNQHIFEWAICICLFLFVTSAIALPSILPAGDVRDRDYDLGVRQIIEHTNNTLLAYEEFQRANINDELAVKLLWCLPYHDLTDNVNYNTGPISDNIRALEQTINNEMLGEIGRSIDSVTSVSYLYKYRDSEILVINVYSDGTVFVSKSTGFYWLNDGIVNRADIGDPLFYKYISTDLYRDLLDAVINTDPEFLPDSQPLDCEGALEYVNVTMDGVSFSTYGYRKVGENSIFGDTIENVILQILDQVDEKENQVSYEEFGESIVPKHEEVGNTSLTNYRWVYYYYHQ